MTSLFEMDRLAGDYAEDLFAKGYILSKRLPSCPSGWQEGEFDEHIIAHHPDLRLSSAARHGSAVACLGTIFDSRSPEISQQDYLDQLAVALSRSEADMHEVLAHSNGRYVLLYRGEDGRAYLVHDATGMRAALYHVGAEVTVSSHLKLLELDVASSGKHDTRDFRFGFPGRLTPNRQVHLLTPNTRLCMSSGNITRFWPNEAIKTMPLSEAADQVALLLRNSFDWVNHRFDHFTTLTAGLDSRVTLSIIGNETRYATYYRKDDVDTDALDKTTTETLAENFGLNHTILGPDTRENIPDGFRKVVRYNTFRSHIPGMPWAYRNHMVKDPYETVHIRSNLSEIGRMFYQNRGSWLRNGHGLNKLWTAVPEMRNDENAEAFQEFADATRFFEAPVEHSSLFYWEHRMGSWHSQVPLESDIACETLSLYNCRNLLAKMWSVSEHAQKKSLLLKRIIATRWPELTNFEVNGKPFQSGSDNDHKAIFSSVGIKMARD